MSDAPRSRWAWVRERPWTSDLVAALPAWVVARLAVAVAYLVAAAGADELVDGPRPEQVDEGLLAWDGAWYRDIAEGGYESVPEQGLRFFPLVPVLSRVAGVVLPGGAGIGLVVVANVSALALGAMLHRLVLRETSDEGAARRAVWFLALLPPAVVLVWGYSEATMMALAVVAFLALRRGLWWGAAIAGLLAGLSRPVGAVLAVPAAIEVARGWRSAPVEDRAGRAAAVVSPLAGVGAFLAWVEWRFGSGLEPLRAQQADDLRGGFVAAPVRVWDALVDLFGGEAFGAGLHVPWIIGFAVLLVVVFRRLPASYGAFAAAVLLVALSAESLGSFERYGLSAFPLVIALALVLDRPTWERAALVLSGAGLVAFGTMTWLGVFVP